MQWKEYLESKGLSGKSEDEIKMWLINNLQNKIRPMYIIEACSGCGEVLEDNERRTHSCEIKKD